MHSIYTDRDAELGGLVVEPRQRELRHRDLFEGFRFSIECLLFRAECLWLRVEGSGFGV